MEKDILIRKKADQFKTRLEFVPKYDYDLTVKNELSLMLYNFEFNNDKLTFLYQTIKNINELLEKHNIRCTHKIDPENCSKNVYYEQLIYFTEQEIRRLNPSYEFSILHPHINSNIIKENLINLETYPKTAKIYIAALDKINQESYNRNLLDDLRLCIEILLKDILNNNKSLENQKEELGKYLKNKNVSKEVTNMFTTLIDYFGKYQNSYVKHDDKVNKREIELMINLTSSFINFLLNL